MIVRDLDPFRTLVRPEEADAILIIDSDAVLTFSIPGQGLQLVAGRHGQGGEGYRGVELIQLALGDAPDSLRARFPGCLRGLSIEDILRSLVVKRNDHADLAL